MKSNFVKLQMCQKVLLLDTGACPMKKAKYSSLCKAHVVTWIWNETNLNFCSTRFKRDLDHSRGMADDTPNEFIN